MADKEKVSLDKNASVVAPGRGPTQLRLRAFEPRRKKKLTAAGEVRAFLFILMLVLALAIAALSLTTDPAGVLLHFLDPILP
jgi:hypothetical protein